MLGDCGAEHQLCSDGRTCCELGDTCCPDSNTNTGTGCCDIADVGLALDMVDSLITSLCRLSAVPATAASRASPVSMEAAGSLITRMTRQTPVRSSG